MRGFFSSIYDRSRDGLVVILPVVSPGRPICSAFFFFINRPVHEPAQKHAWASDAIINN